MTEFIKPHIEDNDQCRTINNLFCEHSGQVNVLHVYPKTIFAWRRNQSQINHWFCVKGSFKIGLYDPEEQRLKWEYLNEYDRRVLVIPAETWYGYKNMQDQEGILLQRKKTITNGHEEQRSIGSFGDCWK